MSNKEILRPQDINATPWYRKPQLPWLIISHGMLAITMLIVGWFVHVNYTSNVTTAHQNGMNEGMAVIESKKDQK